MKRSIGTLIAVNIIGITTLAGAQPGHQTPRALKGDHSQLLAEQPDAKPIGARTDATGKLFLALDENADGDVSRDEFSRVIRAHVMRRVSQRFGQIDKNKDGRVTRLEVQGMSAARFARFDRNQDGHFDRQELGGVMLEQAMRRVLQLFAGLDADQDGICTRIELGTYRQALAEKRATAERRARVEKQAPQGRRDVARSGVVRERRNTQ
jgi:Ca2+-binding EF-hand superfamily protein